VSDITEDMYYERGFIWFFSMPSHSWLFYKNCGFLTHYIHLSHTKFAGISVQLRKQHKILINKTKTVFAVV